MTVTVMCDVIIMTVTVIKPDSDGPEMCGTPWILNLKLIRRISGKVERRRLPAWSDRPSVGPWAFNAPKHGWTASTLRQVPDLWFCKGKIGEDLDQINCMSFSNHEDPSDDMFSSLQTPILSRQGQFHSVKLTRMWLQKRSRRQPTGVRLYTEYYYILVYSLYQTLFLSHTHARTLVASQCQIR